MAMRDEFPERVKDTLAKRVGFRCSNPECGQLTSGPHSDPQKTVGVGVAAHVVAAALGGPRSDGALSAKQRKSIENGIWLCQTCSKLIDSDTARYDVQLFQRWKESAERRAASEIEHGRGDGLASDFDTLRMYRVFLDRPALQDSFRGCGNYADFVAALTQLIELLNTGHVRGVHQAKGRDQLGTAKQAVEATYHAVRELRARYVELRQMGVIGERQCRCNFRDDAQRESFEALRCSVVDAFDGALREAGLLEIGRHP